MLGKYTIRSRDTASIWVEFAFKLGRYMRSSDRASKIGLTLALASATARDDFKEEITTLQGFSFGRR